MTHQYLTGKFSCRLTKTTNGKVGLDKKHMLARLKISNNSTSSTKKIWLLFKLLLKWKFCSALTKTKYSISEEVQILTLLLYRLRSLLVIQRKKIILVHSKTQTKSKITSTTQSLSFCSMKSLLIIGSTVSINIFRKKRDCKLVTSTKNKTITSKWK